MTDTPDSIKCILCQVRDADSAEHIMKRSQLQNEFENAVELDKTIMLLGPGRNVNEPKKLQGPKSKLVKFSKSLCSHCNNALSQPSDESYDRICKKYANRDLLSFSKLVDSFGFPLYQTKDIQEAPEYFHTYIALFKLDLIGIYTYIRHKDFVMFGASDGSSYIRDVKAIKGALDKIGFAKTIPYHGNIDPIKFTYQEPTIPYFAKVQCCFLHEWEFPIPTELREIFTENKIKNIHAEIFCFKPWLTDLPIMFLSHCFVSIKGKIVYVLYQEIKDKNIAFFVYFELENPSEELKTQMKKIMIPKIASGHINLL